jgi:hypothetical protein
MADAVIRCCFVLNIVDPSVKKTTTTDVDDEECQVTTSTV